MPRWQGGAFQPVVVTALALSAVSLVPMVAATLALYLAPNAWSELSWQVIPVAGAIALSILGAIHWGLALAQDGTDAQHTLAACSWSTVPAILGWATLVLEMAGGPTAMLLGVAFSAQFVADRRAQQAGYCPQWYLVMRSRQTTTALACLLAALLAGAHY